MKFTIHDTVEKTGGDYRFRGVVVAVFAKLSGAVRVVVENRDGVLHIFNENQLCSAKPDPCGCEIYQHCKVCDPEFFKDA